MGEEAVPKLDFQQEIRKYERHADCVACGLCCRFVVFFIPRSWATDPQFRVDIREHGLVVPVNEQAARDEDFLNYLNIHGLSIVKIGQDYSVDLRGRKCRVVQYGEAYGVSTPAKCRHLLDNNLCGVYGKPERPQMCDTFPQHPAEFIGLADCSYSFSGQEGETYRAFEKELI